MTDLILWSLPQSSTKGAIVTFTKSLAAQLSPKGIRVCGVAPGPVFTPLQPASRSGEQMEGWGVGESESEESHSEARSFAHVTDSSSSFAVPLHGRVGQPAELGESYVYCATANLLTGQVVHPNSGQVPFSLLGDPT